MREKRESIYMYVCLSTIEEDVSGLALAYIIFIDGHLDGDGATVSNDEKRFENYYVFGSKFPGNSFVLSSILSAA